MQIHELKCEVVYFDAIARGDKPFEVRRDDRGFQKGDIIELTRWHGIANCMAPVDQSGRAVQTRLRRRITYILTGGQLGIEPGYVVLGLADESASQKQEG